MRNAAEETLLRLARDDPRIVLVGSDLGAGALARFRQVCPERVLMEGISEQYIIGMCAGLAASGMVPYVQTISTFMVRRAFEQIFIDLGLQGLPVRLLGGGGGLVYAPLGPTHTALEDVALLRQVPGMAIVAPRHPRELSQLMVETVDWPGPVYFRMAKPPFADDGGAIAGFGKAALLLQGGDVLLASTGPLSQTALDAASILQESRGLSCAVLHCHTLHPFDGAAVRLAAKGKRFIVSLEEHLVTGGLGSLIAETLNDGCAPALLRLGLPQDAGSRYGERSASLSWHGLSGKKVAQSTLDALDRLSR
jgi:transketolase